MAISALRRLLIRQISVGMALGVGLVIGLVSGLAYWPRSLAVLTRLMAGPRSWELACGWFCLLV